MGEVGAQQVDEAPLGSVAVHMTIPSRQVSWSLLPSMDVLVWVRSTATATSQMPAPSPAGPK